MTHMPSIGQSANDQRCQSSGRQLLEEENVAPKGYTKKLFEQDEKNRLQDEHTELNYSDPKVQSCLAALGITTMESDKVWRPAKTSS